MGSLAKDPIEERDGSAGVAGRDALAQRQDLHGAQDAPCLPVEVLDLLVIDVAGEAAAVGPP